MGTRGRRQVVSAAPEQPLPRRVRPRRSCIVAATPFGGGRRLAEFLAESGALPRPRQYFRPERVGDLARSWGLVTDGADFLGVYLREVVAHSTNGAGVASLLLHGDQLIWLLRLLRTVAGAGPAGDECALVESCFPQPTYVLIERPDADRQALQWYALSRPERFAQLCSGTLRPADARERLQEIRWLESLLLVQRARWRDYFGRNEIEPLVVDFDDVVARPEAVTGTVLARLGRRRPGKAGPETTAEPTRPGDAVGDGSGAAAQAAVLATYLEWRDRLDEVVGGSRIWS